MKIRFSLWFASVSLQLSNSFIIIPNVVRCRGSVKKMMMSLTNEGQQTPVQKKQEQIMEMASIKGSEVSIYLTFSNII